MANVTYVEGWSRVNGTVYVECKSRAQARRYCEVWNGRQRILVNAGRRTKDEMRHFRIVDAVPEGRYAIPCDML